MAETQPPHVATVPELRAVVRDWKARGERVAVVPTMGALHDGHLELVRLARRHAARVVVSIFVNPAQFAPHEDLDRYPRTLQADLARLATVPCDLVWAPTPGEMYPGGFATRIVPAGAAEGLEGDFRPHFFAGVATVCCKLFTQTGADVAVFGEKDYQQLAVVRQMVRDLDLPLEIVGAPTVREADGLAMSSRNRYLSEEQRRIAPALARALRAAAADLDGMTAGGTAGKVRERIEAAHAALSAAGFGKIDYVEACDAVTLGPWLPGSGRPLRVLAAAWLGQTRLIDNVGSEGAAAGSLS